MRAEAQIRSAGQDVGPTSNFGVGPEYIGWDGSRIKIQSYTGSSNTNIIGTTIIQQPIIILKFIVLQVYFVNSHSKS